MRFDAVLGATIVGVALAGSALGNDEPVASSASCKTDYAAIKALEISEIEKGLDVYRRFMSEALSESDLSEAEIESLNRMQAILDDRSRPVDRHDLALLDSAYMSLSDPTVWDRADDRECSSRDEKVSLFCALYFGSVKAIGEYQHRRTALQEVRFAIDDATGERDFEHRMMDFNNLPETSFNDIKQVIERARARVRDRLDLQAKCALQY